MTDWLAAYEESEDTNEQYGLLRAELTRLRGRREESAFFDPDAVRADVARLSEDVGGDLLVFLANDFGVPRAYRPEGVPREAHDEIRRTLLSEKYDDANDDLNAIRRELLNAHPGVHKALVAVRDGDSVRYHLPEGASEPTNFLAVREMVGLVDYATNSGQADGLSVTY